MIHVACFVCVTLSERQCGDLLKMKSPGSSKACVCVCLGIESAGRLNISVHVTFMDQTELQTCAYTTDGCVCTK